MTLPHATLFAAVMSLTGFVALPVQAQPGEAQAPAQAAPDPADTGDTSDTGDAARAIGPTPEAAQGEAVRTGQGRSPTGGSAGYPSGLTPWSTRPMPDDDTRVRYLIGTVAQASPSFFDRDSAYSYKLRPVLALEWGRLRLSTGGGRGLMRRGRQDHAGAGLEGLLRSTDRFNLSLSLNLDRGRSASEEDRARGVPDLPTTVRARVRARYSLTDRWTTALAVSQDILGKDGGMEIDGRLSYTWPMSADTQVTAGLGASGGNGPFMRNEFGVPASAAAVAAGNVFRPRGGLYQTELGVSVAHTLSRRWVAFGGVRYSRLHGDAVRSPLTFRRQGVAVSAGIAWHN